jgi:hypothetical protein
MLTGPEVSADNWSGWGHSSDRSSCPAVAVTEATLAAAEADADFAIELVKAENMGLRNRNVPG